MDKIALNELRLYIDNDADLYRQRTMPTLANIMRKIKSKTYLHERAPLLWRYLIDRGANKYCDEFGCKLRDTFPVPLRQQLAQDLADYYYEEIKLGNYSSANCTECIEPYPGACAIHS